MSDVDSSVAASASCLSDEYIQQWLQGTLADSLRAAADAHLADCGKCRNAVADARLFQELQSACRQPDFLEGNLPGAATLQHGEVDDATSQANNWAIDDYEILGELHRGGQGVVYRAIQTATKRPVALKVLLHGPFASPRQRQRFEREIDLIASLQHPNIVTIYDSGISQGRQYYAMEYVDGLPFDEYLATQSAPDAARPKSKKGALRATLQLFQKVCTAVGYAHARGVIHRDLKPNNILVDEAGEPHVLDFGLAKTADPDDDGLHRTEPGEFLGTLAYASPEQAGDSRGIDVRTDVYSLGVMLFQLLTGKFPYLVNGPFSDVLHRIRHEEPLRPSRIASTVDDELETIALKALAKDPDRRYQTAEELGRDIGHYLAGEAINAKRDSTFYLLRKSLRRYRTMVAVATAFLIVISGGLCVSLALWHESIRARDRALQAEKDTRLALFLESEQRARAEFEKYVATIAASDSAIRLYDVAAAVRSLSNSPRPLRDWEWWYLLSNVDRSRQTIDAAAGAISFSIDPTRRFLAAGSYPGNIELWLLDESPQCTARRKLDSAVHAIEFRPRGDLLAVGSDRGLVLLDSRTLETIVVLAEHEQVNGVAFSGDGMYLAAGTGTDSNSSAHAWIWELATRQLVRTIPGIWGRVNAVAFSPDDQWLAFADRDLNLWDWQRGDDPVVVGKHDDNWIWSLSFSSDGNQLLSTGLDNKLRTWDLLTRSAGAEMRGHDGFVYAAQFSPDHRLIASVSHDTTLRIWDATSGELIQVLWGHAAQARDVEFVDDRHLMSADWYGKIKLWTLEEPADATATTQYDHGNVVTSLSFSHDGRRLASGSQDRRIHIWDADSGNRLQLLRGHRAAVTEIAFHPQRDLLASASESGTVLLWEGEPMKKTRSLEHPQGVHCLAFHPHRPEELFTGSADGKIRRWNLANGEVTAEWQHHSDGLLSLDFDADGNWMASSDASTVCVWDVESGKVVFQQTRPQRHRFDNDPLVFHPHEALLLMEQQPGEFQLRTATGRVVNTFRHEDLGEAAAFHPEGNRLAIASREGAVKIWDIERGTHLLTIRDAASFVTALTFDQRGGLLAVGNYDGQVRILRGQRRNLEADSE